MQARPGGLLQTADMPASQLVHAPYLVDFLPTLLPVIAPATHGLLRNAPLPASRAGWIAKQAIEQMA
jgi:hypothetical protein